MTFEAQTRKNKLLEDIAQIDAALAKGDSVLTDTYNKLKSEKEIEIVLIDGLLNAREELDKQEAYPVYPLPAEMAAKQEADLQEAVNMQKQGVAGTFITIPIEHPCNICGKICKSNAGLIVHQKKCKVDTKII